MPTSDDSRGAARTALIIGASRGLGHAMAEEFLRKGWQVIGTVRGTARTPLHDLAEANGGRVEIADLDITRPDQIARLAEQLAGRTLDILFVNAGTSNADPHAPIGNISTDAFFDVMLTNALSPMRVVEALGGQVVADGLIGIMSSGQGSIANNDKGGRELYRGSKAALNMFMRSYAARQADSRAMVLMAPGWIRTALGGPDAPFTLEETVPKIVDVLLGQCGKAGLRYLDREGRTVPW